MQPANNASGIDSRHNLIEKWDIRERDIDLLLTEELNCSVEF
jgi:hypothetical protein